MKMSFTKLLFILIMGTAVLFSCKKTEPITEPETPQTKDRVTLTKDSIYLYAQQTYYWNEGMPSFNAFNPRQYNSPEAVVEGIRKLSSNKGLDKYSFIDDGGVATELGGTGGDYGFSILYRDANDLRVKLVYANSNAFSQGLKRGDQILAINGRRNISSSVESDYNFVVDAFFGNYNTIKLEIKKADGSIQERSINRGSYALNPILFQNVYTRGNKKIGYVVFNSFTYNATPLLDAVFTKFAAENITELIVDLRYNGGGSVQTAENLSNLIVPLARNKELMYTTYWTKTMQDFKADILKNQKFWYTYPDGPKAGQRELVSMFDIDYRPTEAAGNRVRFQKRGSVNGLNRVYFLVTKATASASELLINNIRPVVAEVKLIGRNTYGKPVGFFGIQIDKYDLYIPQFETKNQLDIGGYYSGMPVDKEVVDDVTKEFGDETEMYLFQALNYANTNTFSSYLKDNILNSKTGMSRRILDNKSEELDHSFKGMVETRLPQLKR